MNSAQRPELMTKIGFASVNELVHRRECYLNLRSPMTLDPEYNGEASVDKHVNGYRYIAVTIESCLRCLCATSQ